jgi:hypothetical protein
MRLSIFAIELCVRLVPHSDLRRELKRLVLSHPAASGVREKSELLRRACELLVGGEELFEMGCWDFFDDDARARRDYEMWSNGMITEEGSRKEPSGDPERWGEPRYMTFTIAMLLVQGSASERLLAKTCAIPPADLWKKASFLTILRALPSVDYGSVKSDVLYLIPGEEDWGLTPEDLKAPKFDYLRKIEA